MGPTNFVRVPAHELTTRRKLTHGGHVRSHPERRGFQPMDDRAPFHGGGSGQVPRGSVHADEDSWAPGQTSRQYAVEPLIAKPADVYQVRLDVLQH